MKSDYELFYSQTLKPLHSSLPPKPWLLNRRTIGYSLQDLENRYGYYTFLDDDMALHNTIADLKLKKTKCTKF